MLIVQYTNLHQFQFLVKISILRQVSLSYHEIIPLRIESILEKKSLHKMISKNADNLPFWSQRCES